jgi:hypothetical protein
VPSYILLAREENHAEKFGEDVAGEKLSIFLIRGLPNRRSFHVKVGM